jgi:uncharacterized membrane-anchored protein YitT (DUF2179 family)
MNFKALLQPHTEKILGFSLCALCILLSTLYMYFVSASVVHVVMRKELDQEIARISSEISILENDYIKAQHKVSSDIASLQGYKKTAQKIFIDRSSDSLVLSTQLDR